MIQVLKACVVFHSSRIPRTACETHILDEIANRLCETAWVGSVGSVFSMLSKTDPIDGSNNRRKSSVLILLPSGV